MFKMHSNEIIAQMSARFNIITNNLYTLGKSYTSTELVNKIIRSLPKAYQSKVVEIREVRDFFKLRLENFIASFMTNEIKIRNHEKDERSTRRRKQFPLSPPLKKKKR